MKIGVLALWLLLLCTGPSRADDTPLVAVASSLRVVWPLLMDAYQPAKQPRVTFGSSGNLARQIVQGAPFSLLLSADQSYTQFLFDQGVANQAPITYVQGKLAWVALPNTPLANMLESVELDAEDIPIYGKHINRLAMANPAFAPYGRAAKEVLSQYQQTEHIKFTLGENAAQALQFALSGANDGGIVPLSLVSTEARAKLPTIVVREIDATQHQAIVHSMVSIGELSNSGKALFEFMLSKSAQRIFERNGFKSIKQ